MLFRTHDKRLAFAAGMVYFGVESLGGMIFIPFLSRHEGAPRAAFWVYILAFVPLVQLAVSGFVTLNTRDVAAALARQDKVAIGRIVGANHRLAGRVILAFALLLAVCYFVLIRVASPLPRDVTLLVWAVFSAALLLRANALRSFSIINGFGVLGVDRVAWASASLLVLAGSLYLVHLGVGILGLGFIHLLIYAMVMLLGRQVEARVVGDSASTTGGGKIESGNPEVWKVYLMGVGGFLTMYADVLIVQKFSRPEELVEYGMLSKFPMALIALASLYVQVQFPQLSATAASKARTHMESSVARIRRSVMAVIVSGGLVFLLLGPTFVRTLLGRSLVLPKSIYAVMAIYACLAAYVIVKGQAIISMGDSRLVIASISTAILGFVLACLLASKFGPIGVPTGNALALLLSAGLHRHIYLSKLEQRYA